MDNIFELFKRNCLDTEVTTFQLTVGAFTHVFIKVPCGKGIIIYSEYTNKDDDVEAFCANLGAVKRCATVSSTGDIFFSSEYEMRCWEQVTGFSPIGTGIQYFYDALEEKKQQLHDDKTVPFWNSLEVNELLPLDEDLRYYAFRQEYANSKDANLIPKVDLSSYDYRLFLLGLLDVEDKWDALLEESKEELMEKKILSESVQAVIRDHSYMTPGEFEIADAIKNVPAKALTVTFSGFPFELKVKRERIMDRLARNTLFCRYDLVFCRYDLVDPNSCLGMNFSTKDIVKIEYRRETLYQA